MPKRDIAEPSRDVADLNSGATLDASRLVAVDAHERRLHDSALRVDVDREERLRLARGHRLMHVLLLQHGLTGPRMLQFFNTGCTSPDGTVHFCSGDVIGNVRRL